MTLFEGKSSTERNKIIAAGVLGLVALVALYLAFGRSFFGSSSTTATTTKNTPTPKPGGSPGTVKVDVVLPSADEQRFQYETTPVVYNAGNSYAPDPGRNIFAFYEPPPPTPFIPPSPTPIVIKPPSPSPTPVFVAGYVTPPNVYAGSPGFRLEVNGDRFTPDARIYFNQTEMPTTFVNAQKLFTDIPQNLISQEGPRQIIVQTPDGRAYSTQLMLTVQAPPNPGNFQYIGMIGRKRYNNDTAYFLEKDKPTPFGARLNDIVGGRFRLIDISAAEVVFEDINLGFKHRVSIAKSGGTGSSVPAGRSDGFTPFIPGSIPGIPNNMMRPTPQPKQPEKKEDVDDNDIPGDE